MTTQIIPGLDHSAHADDLSPATTSWQWPTRECLLNGCYKVADHLYSFAYKSASKVCSVIKWLWQKLTSAVCSLIDRSPTLHSWAGRITSMLSSSEESVQSELTQLPPEEEPLPSEEESVQSELTQLPPEEEPLPSEEKPVPTAEGPLPTNS